MLVLSLDSASIASVALSRDGEVLREAATTDTRSHAEALAPAVHELLAAEGLTGRSLDAVLVGTGPGPFTGLRAGLVTARTLGFAWGLPVHGLCSLDAAAHRAAPLLIERGQTEFAVVTDARRKELYWRTYTVCTDDDSVRAVPASDPRVGPAEDVPAVASVGPGTGLYPDRLASVVPGTSDLHPTAADLARAAWALTSRGQTLSADTAPLYLRDSDATVPASVKRTSA